jgi:hypothetical protein
MTRYTPAADRLAVRRIRRIETKAQPQNRKQSVRSAINESWGR